MKNSKEQKLEGSSKDKNMKEDILEQGEKQKIDIEDVISVKEGGDFINRFNKLQKECLKKFDKIDKNTKISNNLQEKEKFVEKKLKSEETKKILKKGGIDNKKIEEIQKKLIDNHQKITEFFIKENEIYKREKRNNRKKKELEQLKKEINNKAIDRISNKLMGSLEFVINIKNFEAEISDVYKEIVDKMGRTKEEIEPKIQQIKIQYKNILFCNEKKHFTSYKDKEIKEKPSSDLLDKIIEKVEEEWQLKKQKEELKKEKEKNIKTLVRAFGFKIENEELDQLLRLSDKINKEAVVEAVKKEAEEEEKTDKKIKKDKEELKKELEKAKKEGGIGFLGFLGGSGHCLLALLLFWISKKIGGEK